MCRTLPGGCCKPYAQAVPLVFAIDTDTCIGCGLCENLCAAKAVNYHDKERGTSINVGSIILSPGSKGFDTSIWDTGNIPIWLPAKTLKEF
jgi:heterodisulfide reductase subunit A-like polyferredoxin